MKAMMATSPATPLIVAPMIMPARWPPLVPVLASLPGSDEKDVLVVGVCVEEVEEAEEDEDFVEEEEDDDDDDDDDDEEVEVEEDVVFEDEDELDDDKDEVNVPVKVTRWLLMARDDLPDATAATLWPIVLAEPQPY